MTSPFYAKGDPGDPVDLVTQTDRTMEFFVQGNSIGTVDVPPYNPIIYHGTDPNVARITGITGTIIWIGSVAPIYALNGDEWHDISGDAAVITTTSLATLNEDAPTVQQLVASGTTPIVWSVTAGTLPTALALSTSGELTGTPAATGAYDFTVTATNGYGSDTQNYTGTIAGPIAPTVTTTVLNAMFAGAPFTQSLFATGSAPITWAVTSGTITAGLSLSSGGTLSGTPSTAGAYSFTVTATNSTGSDTQAYSGTVAAATAPVITTTTLDATPLGVSFSNTIVATGSTPITWSVTTGSLPAGLSLNSSTGVISGTPTTAGAYSFTLTATNSAGNDTQAFSGTVAANLPQILSIATGNYGSFVTSTSWNHVVEAGADTVFVYLMTYFATTGPTLTFGGNAMTPVVAVEYATYYHLRVFQYDNPPSGTQAVVATLSAYSVAGRSVTVDNVSSYGTVQTANGNSALATKTFTSDADELLLVFIGTDTAQDLSGFTGDSGAYNDDMGNFDILFGTQTGATSSTVSATVSPSGVWALVAIPMLA